MKRLLAIVLILAACGGSVTTLEGTVVAFEGDLTTVTSFTVRTPDGEFTLRPAATIDSAFPLPHLREHMTTGDPVRVSYEVVGDDLIATRVDDG